MVHCSEVAVCEGVACVFGELLPFLEVIYVPESISLIVLVKRHNEWNAQLVIVCQCGSEMIDSGPLPLSKLGPVGSVNIFIPIECSVI